LVDTRVGEGKSGLFGPPSLPACTSRNFPLLSGGCAIPLTGVQAYSLNFTAVPDGPLGFLSAWPTGSAYPGVSTLNSTDGSVIANAAIVTAGTGGNIYCSRRRPNRFDHRHQRLFRASRYFRTGILSAHSVPHRGHTCWRRKDRSLRASPSASIGCAGFPDRYQPVSLWLAASIFFEHDCGSRRTTQFYVGLARGTRLSGSIDAELLGRQHHRERSDRSRRDGRSDCRGRREPDRSDYRYRRLLRSVTREAADHAALRHLMPRIIGR
jgi:hypothetical protein